MAVVAHEVDANYTVVGLRDGLDDLPSAIDRSIVDEHDLVAGVNTGSTRGRYPAVELGQALLLVEARRNDRKGKHSLFSCHIDRHGYLDSKLASHLLPGFRD